MTDDGEVWLICGGRKFADQGLFDRAMRVIVEERGLPALIVHGGATGADTMADQWGKRMPGVEVKRVDAEWHDLSHPDAIIRVHPKTGKQYDAKAGGRRNQKMLDEWKPDLGIAFPGFTGTADMTFKLLRAKVTTMIVEEGVIRTIVNTSDEEVKYPLT